MSETGYKYIVQTEGVCGGKPRIAGTGMKVEFIAIQRYHDGWAFDEICSTYPHLTEAEVRAALDYYGAHKDEINQDISESCGYLDLQRLP